MIPHQAASLAISTSSTLYVLTFSINKLTLEGKIIIAQAKRFVNSNQPAANQKYN